MDKEHIARIARRFALTGEFHHAIPYGSGHINNTYRMTAREGITEFTYVLQRLNDTIFQDGEAVMRNIRAVLDHLQGPMRLVATLEGDPWVRDDDGAYWRCYNFVENSYTVDVVEDPGQAYRIAFAFGEFHRALVDYNGPRLKDTIPQFHHTPSRYQHFEEAVAADVATRVAGAEAEIAFAKEREGIVSRVVDALSSGELPERITHNDTKLNNVLLDQVTGEGVCVIDLDTVMPGSILYDFGDFVRTTTCLAPEDCKDLDRMQVEMELFEAITRGFLDAAGALLDPAEVKLFPFSGQLITLEIGLRFLTDYLQGDTYFKTHYPEHNLDRARAQFALVRSIEAKIPEMEALVARLSVEFGAAARM